MSWQPWTPERFAELRAAGTPAFIDFTAAWCVTCQYNKKTTLAELQFLDLPGFDLRDETGRNHAKAHWAAMRQSDMLVFVVRSFQADAVAAYRVEVENFESIHNHSAYALIERDKTQDAPGGD